MVTKSSASVFEAKAYSDRAVDDPEKDLLNRRGYAENLAKRLAHWRGESLVVALYGPWGSGKSSIKNMALNYLRENYSDTVDVVEFCPWQFTGDDQLLLEFFELIGEVLSKEESGINSASRSEKWNRLKILFSAGSSITKGLGFAAGLVGIPGAKPLLDLLTEGLENGRNAAESASSFTSQQGKSINILRHELRKSFQELTKSVLVVIDDLDRLTSEEIILMMRLVKANADFPNLNYLILCDREKVAGALQTIVHNSGEEFLDKIVQIPIDVPTPPIGEIQRVLLNEVSKISVNVSYDRSFTSDDRKELWLNGILPYFGNLRSVYRYLNSLALNAHGFSTSRGAYEVNFHDLAALEALRIFAPSLYRKLPDMAYQLNHSFLWVTDRQKEEWVERLSKDLENSDAKLRKGNAKILLLDLFPALRNIFGSTDNSWSKQDELRAERRVASDDFFDKYFSFALSNNHISEDEIECFIDEVNTKNDCSRLSRWNEQGLFSVGVRRIGADYGKIKSIGVLLLGLADNSSGLTGAGADMFNGSDFQLAVHVSLTLLQATEEKKTRIELLGMLITEAKYVDLALNIFR